MSDIYEQHKAHFALVEAFVVLKDNERVATVAFRFPKDGAGRLYAYVHWIGVEMVRGHAAGGGYDKRTAACSSAVAYMASKALHKRIVFRAGLTAPDYQAFRDALAADRGPTWDSALRAAGFTVLQAV
jgi:hypothetical protein